MIAVGARAGRALWPLLAALMIAGVSAAASWSARGWLADREIAELRAEHAQQVAAAHEAAARESERQRSIEAADRAALEAAAHEARTQLDAVRRARAGDADLTRRLREHVTRLAAAAGEASDDPTAAAGGEAAAGPGLVLADMLGGLEARGREAADAATEARIAAAACASAYDAVRLSREAQP